MFNYKLNKQNNEQGDSLTIAALFFVGLLLCIIFALLAVGGWFFTNQNSSNNGISLPGYNNEPGGPDRSGFDEVAENVAKATIPAGSASEGVMDELVPPTIVLNSGDVEKMYNTFSNLVVSVGQGSYWVSEGVGVTGHGAYSYMDHSGTDDTTTPLLDQVMSGDVRLYPGTEHFAGITTAGSLVAGVTIKDVLSGFDYSVKDLAPIEDLEENTVTVNQTINVTYTLNVGLFGVTEVAGSTAPTTYVEPNGMMAELIDLNKDWGNFVSGEENHSGEYSRTMADMAMRYAFDLAYFNMIAPFTDDGRDMSNLNRVQAEFTTQWTQPNPNLNGPVWAYSNLLILANQSAQAAGFTGVDKLTVIIQHPCGDGVWYWLDTMDQPRGDVCGQNWKPVLGPDDAFQFRNNLKDWPGRN